MSIQPSAQQGGSQSPAPQQGQQSDKPQQQQGTVFRDWASI